MKPYIGAAITGGELNEQAERLQKYLKKVLAAPDEEALNTVQFSAYETVKKVVDTEDITNNYDMIVFNMKKMNKEVCMDIINGVLGDDKEFHAAILVFPSELDHYGVLAYLRRQQSETSLCEFKVVPLLFRAETHGSADIRENIKYALLFGKLEVLKSPLLVCYSNINQLIQVVDSVCPPLSRVALVSDPGVPCIKIHNSHSERRVTYFGAQRDISKFMKKLGSQRKSSDDHDGVRPGKSQSDSEETPSDSEEVPSDSEGTPSTSSTPVKTVPVNLDDSGFAEKYSSGSVKSF